MRNEFRNKLRSSWYQMIRRCTNPKCKKYPLYGGRGISVTDEWTAFESFEKWAMGAGYRSGLTIDRINSNGNYEPDNCRWIPLSEQSTNRAGVMIIEWDGIKLSEAAWCKRLGFPNHGIIRDRLKAGLSLEQAMNPTSYKGKKLKEIKNETSRH